MGKIIISVAPTAAADTKIDREALVRDITASRNAGAAMVHMHVRDPLCRLTDDISFFKEIAEAAAEKSGIVIQGSTGGVSSMNIKQRCAPLYYDRVESCSLNVGSMNLGQFIYENPIQDVEYCCREIVRQNKYPEAEVFELGMIAAADRLWKKLSMPSPPLYNIVLGHEGGAPADIDTLIAMRSRLPSGCIWGITHAGRHNFDILTAAVLMGASLVRIGFEDSNMLSDTEEAESNAVLVRKFAEILRALGHEPASPADLRQMIADKSDAVLRTSRAMHN